MNKIKNLLFWEKFRPTVISKKQGKGIPLILLPRIKKLIDGFINDDGEIEIKLNLMVYGSGGLGKCVSGDTLVKVRNKDTGEISEIRIDELL